MDGLILMAAALLMTLLMVGVTAIHWAEAYELMCRPRFVRCPLSACETIVAVHPILAATTAVLGRMMVRVKKCSRWPELEGCPEICRRHFHELLRTSDR